MNIKVGISNRHVHLKKEDINTLFGENYELTKRNDLSQLGEFACIETVTIKTEKNEIKNVRVLGPIRSYSQVEISKTDSYSLGINPPVRASGDLNNAPFIEVIGPKGKTQVPAIIAERHIHINTNELNEKKLQDGEIVKIKINGEKSGIINDVSVKAKDTYTFELHLDTDDANAFILQNQSEVEIIKGE